MVFSLLPTAVLAADGENPDTPAGFGQATQQDSENLGNQSDPDNQEGQDDQKNQDDQAGQDDKAGQDDQKNQDNLKDSEKPDVLPDLENVSSSNILKAPATSGVVASIGTVEYSDLQDAITAAQPGETVKLLQDIAYDSGANIHIEKEVTLDLNGKSITAKAIHDGDLAGHFPSPLWKSFILIKSGGKLTITDDSGGTGSITVNGDSGARFECVYAVVVDFEGAFELNNATITSNSSTKSVPIYAAGPVTVNGGTLSMTGRGSTTIEDYTNYEVCLNSGTFTGSVESYWLGEGAYAQYDGTETTVSDVQPSEYAARLQSRDRIYYMGIDGANEALADADVASGDTLTLNNVTPTGQKTFRRVEPGVNDTLTVKLEGTARFDPQKNLKPADRFKVQGTKVDDDTTTYSLVTDEDAATAKIGSVYYATVEDATVAAKDGDTITLISDVDINEDQRQNHGYGYDGSSWSIWKTLTLDLNGHTLSGNVNERDAAEDGMYDAVLSTRWFDGETVTLTILDSSPEKTGTIRNISTDRRGSHAIAAPHDTIIKVYSGNFFGSVNGDKAVGTPATYGNKPGQVEITGGTFDMDVSKYIDPNCSKVVKNDNGTYTVFTSAPSAPTLTGLSSPIQVKCVDTDRPHTNGSAFRYYSFIKDGSDKNFTAITDADGNTVYQNDDGEWTYTIVLDKAKFIQKFNDATGAEHKDTAPDETIRLTWTYKNRKWNPDLDSYKCYATINVSCKHETCTVTFDPNAEGVTDPESVTVSSGETLGERLPSLTREGYTFLGWFTNAEGGDQVMANTVITESRTLFAHWVQNAIPKPTDADFANGLVTVKCLSPVAHTDVQYGLNAAVAADKYVKEQVNATEYSVTYDADAFAVNGHSLYSADKLNWKLTYDGSKWNLKPQHSDVDDVVLVTHAPTTFDEVTKFIDGRTDVIHTSCVNGETATCAYGLMVAFMNPDHVVSVEQEKDGSGQPIRGSYIATLKMDQFAAACAKACNDKSFTDSPRTHDVRSKNPVQWRFQVTPAEVSTDTGTEKTYVWSAEPVEADKDDVCQLAHRVVLTFSYNQHDVTVDETKVEYKYNTTEITNNVEVPTPTREGYTFVQWLDAEGNAFDPTANVTEDHTYDSIEWKPIKYRVIFNANAGGKNVTGTMEDQVFTYDQPQTLNPNQFVCTDSVFDDRLKQDTQLYEFGGWNTKADGSGTLYADEADFTNQSVKNGERITLYAQWKHVTKTLTYVSAYGTAPSAADVDIFSEVTVADAPANVEGYTFVGWRSDIDGLRETFKPGDKFVMPNTDVTLTAQWQPVEQTYTVTFNTDGADQQVQALTDVPENTFITLPDMLTKDGYAFKGWKIDETNTVYAAGSTYKVTSNVTFTAQFVEIPVPETFAVTFDTNGAAESVSNLTGILGGTCITLPVGLTKADCTFDGWTLRDSTDNKVYAAGSTYQVNGNVTFVAKFTEIPAPTTYAVTFNTSGADQTVQERTVVENTEITLPGGLTKANSVFKGWRIGETDTVYAADSTYVVKENTVFTAVFETAVTYTVAFNANGADQTVSNMSNVAAGSYITLPTGLTKQNATFLGWMNGDTLYAAGSPYQVNSNLEFTAEFKAAETFTVTYKDGDWTSETPESYKAGEWVTVKNPASATGYTFGGWESNTGETYQPGKQFKMPDTNVVLTAKWVANTYTITWMGADGELMQTTVQHGEIPVYSGATPTKDSTVDKTYTFKGWDPEITEATEDTTYTAQFEEAARTYKITWKDEGGAILKTEQVAYNGMPNFDGTPTKDGDAQYSYTFKGWTPTIAPVTGDAEYCATYTKTVNKYTITWVIDGTTETQTYEYGKMPAHADPVKPATDDTVYTFKGWTPALSIVTGNVTYTAQFDEITKHTVSYDLDGGTPAIAPAKYAAGDVATTPETVPTKTGYVFTGWLVSFENKTVNANGSFTMPNTNVTLTAQWRVAITGSVYIPAMNPKHGVHEEYYSAQLTAKKDNATGDPVAAGDVQFVLIDANGHADTSRNIGHGLKLNADGSITGTANGAGEVTFRVKLANADGDFVSDAFEFTIVIDKALRTCTVTMEDWTYGEAAKTPSVSLSKTEGTESYTYFYKIKGAENSTYTQEVPVNAGDYTVKVVVAESANYKSCEDTDDFTIHKALITSVDPDVTAPVACEAAQSTIANGDGYTGTIAWDPADATFQYSTVYAATVVLTPDSNHKFDNTTTAENGWTLELNENGTLTLTKVFPETAQDTVKTPVIRPNGGRFYGSETITITCPTDGADIYYTLDGTTPTTDSKPYTGAFKIKESTTVKAIAVKANYIDSAVATAEFTKRTGGNGGGGGGTVVTPVKPSKKDDSLRFNTEDHFAFVNGYPDGTVKPNGNVTRAEVAAILYRVMDADCVKTYETTRCSFSDVVRGDWFNLYVATLENAGVIVDTRTNGKFRPNEAITRAELAAMLAQFADIKSAANSFNDVSARHWASDEIAVCAKMGWINGYPDGSFRPDATITRAEMMAMINRALGRTPKSADDLLSGMKTWRDNANVNAWYYLDVQEATNSHTYTKSGSHETWKKLR